MNVIYRVMLFDGEEYLELHCGYDVREALDERDYHIINWPDHYVWVEVDYEYNGELH